MHTSAMASKCIAPCCHNCTVRPRRARARWFVVKMLLTLEERFEATRVEGALSSRSD